VALLVTAAFWTFLWGPIGLVLSGPLTVCLVVLGRHVPQLEFFAVLLGDEPPLEPDVIYYQRLLAADQDEAAEVARAYGVEKSPAEAFDAVLVPALAHARLDRARGGLTERDERLILETTREVVEDLGERPDTPADGAAAVRLLACPARDEADELALEMLRGLLDPARWQVEVTGYERLSAELLELADERRPAAVCIGSLPPGGLSHTRYLCKRLRAKLPDVKILVGRWGLRDGLDQNKEQLREAGADEVATTLREARDLLTAWLPVLADRAAVGAGGATAAAAADGPQG
jgi:hypothetical protein